MKNKNLYTYVDYRQFLKDRFSEMKQENKRITHRYLMEIAGFSSPNFLMLVMNGKRNLTEKSLSKVAKAMDIEGKEKEFFKALVKFNQAKTYQEKDQAYEKLRELRYDLTTQRAEHQQFEYFKDWMAVAIRELVSLKNFKEDPEWISDKLFKKVSAAKARKLLSYLEELNLIKRKNGKLHSNQQIIQFHENDVSKLAIYHFHQAMIEKALEALEKTEAKNFDISSATVSVSKETFIKLKKLIKKFRQEFIEIAHEDQNSEVVYQLNIQFFNLSKILWD